MNNTTKKSITVKTIVNAPLSKVWEYWNNPKHITKWAFAQDDWEAPNSENDLRIGGKFKTRMAAKDKSSGFDFEGVYTIVDELKRIEYDMDDTRHVKVEFSEVPEGTLVSETFDMETENTEELQKNGWQAILNNFKKYVEAS